MHLLFISQWMGLEKKALKHRLSTGLYDQQFGTNALSVETSAFLTET